MVKRGINKLRGGNKMQIQREKTNDVETSIVIQSLRSARSPTLDTVEMIEQTIDKYSGEFTTREIWKKLPKKVLWSTYMRTLRYLEESNRIGITKKGIVCYIWNPKLVKKYLMRRYKDERENSNN